jgi:hypothetical protein
MIARICFIAVVLAFIALAAQAQVLPLDELVPNGKWERTGISRLSDSERGALRDEILSILRRYRESLTKGVAVIAPSVSTSMKAREIRVQLKKSEVPFRYAEAILVVVRSSLYNPLQYSYDSVAELQRDADNQLNISGPKFHVYVYSMDDNLAVAQLSHRSLEAD